jgi:hypothetical protein
MILWEDLYAPGDKNRENMQFKLDKESRAELAAAQAIVLTILDHNDVELSTIEPKNFDTGKWLAEDGNLSWRDPGTASLEIPEDIKEAFLVFQG